MSDIFADEVNRLMERTAFQNKKSFGDQIGGIPRNIIASTGEVFGFDPDQETLDWRKKYPVSSFASGLIGIGGVYGAAYKGTQKISKVDELAKGLGKLSKSPIKSRMLEETARVALIEGARIPTVQLLSDEPLAETLWESTINVALTPVATGAFAALSQGRKNPGLQDIFGPEATLEVSQSEFYRRAKAALTDEDDLFRLDRRYELDAQRVVSEFETAIRERTLPKGEAYARELGLNELFTGNKDQIISRQLKIGQGNFKTNGDWQNLLSEEVLPAGWIGYAEFPRVVTFRSAKASGEIADEIKTAMKPAQGDWWIAPDNGAWVMAKKVTGEAAKTAKADRWLVFKTKEPGKFRPELDDWAKANDEQIRFLTQAKPREGAVGEVYDTAKELLENFSLSTYKALQREKKAGRLAKAMGLENVSGGVLGDAGRRLQGVLNEFVVPTEFQFGNSARATRAWKVAKETYAHAEEIAHKLVFGKSKPGDDAAPLMSVILNKTSRGPGIEELAKDLTDDEVRQFWQIWRNEQGMEGVDKLFAEGQITEKVRQFARYVDEVDQSVTAQIEAVEQVAEAGEFQARVGHYGISRYWEGDYRRPVYDADDKLYAVGSGETAKQADKAAEALAEEIGGKLGEPFTLGEALAGKKSFADPELRQIVTNPSFVLEREGVKGFRWHDTPFTKKELIETLFDNMRRRQRYIAGKTVDDLLADELLKLGEELPDAAKILNTRLADLAGTDEAATVVQNRLLDKVVGPEGLGLLGNNSASRIVGTTNSLLYSFQLGMGNIAYAAINALTFVQTVLPETAYVLSAPQGAKKYYTWFNLAGEKNVAPMGALDPAKIWWGSIKLMKKPDGDFLEALGRARDAGVVDARLAEEVIAGGSSNLTKLSDTLKEPDGFIGWMKGLSDFLPSTSERFGRSNAFATGYLVGKDVLQIADADQLYRFAKEFSERTMFNYGSESRAKIFAGPIGGGLGLFKNWMMHYMGLMANYTGEGIAKQNWAPMVWQTGGTFALGGVAATPMFALADMLSRQTTNESLLVNGYEAFAPFGENSSTAIMLGLPAALTGLSLSGQSAAPGSSPMRDASMLFGFAHASRMNAIQQAFGKSVDTWIATGQSPFEDANTRDMFARAFAPKTIQRAVASAQNEAIRSLRTSYPMLQNVSLADRAAYTFGFTPTRLEQGWAVSDELWRDTEKRKTATRRYGQALAEAYKAQDQRLVRQVLRNALADGVDLDGVTQSAERRLDEAELDMFTRGFRPEDVAQRLGPIGGIGRLPDAAQADVQAVLDGEG